MRMRGFEVSLSIVLMAYAIGALSAKDLVQYSAGFVVAFGLICLTVVMIVGAVRWWRSRGRAA